MNDVITSGQSQRVPRKRSTHEEHKQIHGRFLEIWKQGKSRLEIRHALGLSVSQFNGHLAEAVEAEEMRGPHPKPDYAVIKFASLHDRDRKEFCKQLKLNPPDSALLKFERRDGDTIICSLIIDAENTSEKGDDNNDSNN